MNLNRDNPTPAKHGPVLVQDLKRPKSRLTKNEALELVNRKAGLGDRGRNPVHLALQRQWFLDVVQYLGVSPGHLQGVDLQDLDLHLHDVDPGFRSNLIQRFVTYQVSLLSTGKPRMSVLPESNSFQDYFGAKVAEFFLEHYNDELNLPGLMRELLFWVVITGNGFTYADWDHTMGEKRRTYRNPFNDEPMIPEMLGANGEEIRELAEQLGSYDERNDGYICAEVVSPFQVIYPAKPAGKLKDKPWVVIEFPKPFDWVHDRYPKQAREIGSDDFYVHSQNNYLHRLGSLAHNLGLSIPSQGFETDDCLWMREMIIPPSRQFPKGQWIRALRTTVLEHGPHPHHEAGVDLKKHTCMRYPLRHFKHQPVPGRDWGMGLVEQLIPLQNDYNRARHQSIQMRDRLGAPFIMAPMGTAWGNTRNEYGDIMEYSIRPGFGKPEVVPPPPVSSMHVESMDRALQDMRLVAAQGEAVQGDVPTGMRSGAALRALQEKDNMTISPVVEELEEGWQEFCKQLLVLTHTYMDVPRAIQTYGELRGGDVQVFSGSSLNGNMNVRIERGSMRPRSEAEMFQLMSDMVQMGVLNPQDPKALEFFYERAPIDGVSDLFKMRSLDKRRALHENYMFMRPETDPLTGRLTPFPKVDDDDDHIVHLDEHLKFKKSDAYWQLPPMMRRVFDAHMMDHKVRHAQNMQAMMMMQGGPGGQPSRPPGEASQPRERKPTPGTEEANQ